MRKLISIIVIVVASLLLILNVYKESIKDEITSTRNGNIKAEIAEAIFVHGEDFKPYHAENTEGLLKIQLKIKNETSTDLPIEPSNDFILYEDDEQIDSLQNIEDRYLLDELTRSTSIKSGKQKSISVIFPVSFDTKYELHITPKPYYSHEKVDDVLLSLDVNDYIDSYEAIGEPTDVLQAYINMIYFDIKVDLPDTFMDVDIEDLQKQAKQDFLSIIKFRPQTLEDKIADRFYDIYEKELKEKGEVNVSILSNNGERARIKLTHHLPNYAILKAEKGLLVSELEKEHGTLSLNEADENMLKEVEELIRSTDFETKTTVIDMKKKNDRWIFDKKFEDGAEKIKRIFGKGVL